MLALHAPVALLTLAAAGARRARRGSVKRKRRTAGGASAAVATQAAVACATLAPSQRPPALGAVDAGSVSALLRERFAPQLAASTAALAGPRALAAARAGGALGFASEHVRAYDLLAASVAALAAQWTRRAAAQAHWSAAAVRCTAAPSAAAALHLEHGADAAAAPAWRALPYLAAALPCAEEPPVDAMLASLVTHLRAGLAMWQLNAAARLQLLARSSGAGVAADARALLPPAVAALYAEFADGLHAGLAAAALVAALLAQLRATVPLCDFAAAAEQLAALLARYAADAARALADRAVWARALVAEGVPLQPSLPIPAVPPAWHALAAGCGGGGRGR